MSSALARRCSGLPIVLLCALGTVVVASGCEEPRFPDDAGPEGGADVELIECDGAACTGREPRDAESDAEQSSTTDTSDPRARWVGRYAAYSQLWANAVAPSYAEYLAVVEIKREGAGLVLEQQLCRYEGGWSALLVAGSLRFTYPPSARARAELVYDNEGFSTPTMSFFIGQSETAAACTPGATSALPSSEQPWLMGQSCECTTTPAPINDRDCRVTDSDGDKIAGVTMSVLVNADTWLYYVAQQQNIRHLNGYKQGPNLYANLEALDRSQLLGCAGAGAALGCPIGPSKLCPPSYNKTVFVPVEAGFTCQKVIDQYVGLFHPMQPAFPQACSADLAGSAPKP